MIAAQLEAKNFINWLERCSHRQCYESLGEALQLWCSAGSGSKRLRSDYAMFLQMVIVLLVTVKGPLRVGIDVAENEYAELHLPTDFKGWLPDREDFLAAVEERRREMAMVQRLANREVNR